MPDPYPARHYDVLHGDIQEDIDFYAGLARRAGGPVLELGAGTGRVLLPVARLGVQAVGLEPDPGMRAVLERKLAREDARVRERVQVVDGDMRAIPPPGPFSLAYVPFNAFLHLPSPEDQEGALRSVHERLVPGGRLAMAIFDPLHDLLSEHEHTGLLGAPARVLADVEAPGGSGRLLVAVLRRELDHVRQLIHETWCFEELDPAGRSRSRELWRLDLRWTFPQEMRYLFRLTGFEVESLHGGFRAEPFRHGAWQVWTVRRRP